MEKNQNNGHVFRSHQNIESKNINLERRSAILCVSTGSKVLRKSGRIEPFYEELEISERSVDLSRLNNGAALLIDHNNDLSKQIGVVERSWIENNCLLVEVRFSKRPEADSIYQDVQDGIIRNVSFGYSISKFEKIRNDKEKYETIRVTEFMPFEVSLVSIPADYNAGIRGFDFDTILSEGEQREMDKEIEQEKEVKNNDDQIKNEQKRVLEIINQCKKFNIPENSAQEIIENTRNIDEARAKMVDMYNEFFEKNNKVKHPPAVSVGADEKVTLRAGVENALQCRAGVEELNDNGRRFYNLSMIDLCRKFVPESDSLSQISLIKRAVTTSDFPNILLSTIERHLVKSYSLQPQTFKEIVDVREKSNLKDNTEIQIGTFKELESIPEGGLYPERSFSDSKEKYKIEKFGASFSITEEAIINDDLGAILRVPAMFARAAAERESSLVWSQLTNTNNKMSDGKHIFHNDHKNMLQASALNNESIEKALIKIAQQTGLDGEKISLNPKYIIVTKANEAQALRLMSPVAATKISDINIYANRFKIIVEDRLEALGEKSWILACSPTEIDGIVLAYLKGERGLKLTRHEEYRDDSIKYKCRLFAGAKAIDYRGFYLNAGA